MELVVPKKAYLQAYINHCLGLVCEVALMPSYKIRWLSQTFVLLFGIK